MRDKRQRKTGFQPQITLESWEQIQPRVEAGEEFNIATEYGVSAKCAWQKAKRSEWAIPQWIAPKIAEIRQHRIAGNIVLVADTPLERAASRLLVEQGEECVVVTRAAKKRFLKLGADLKGLTVTDLQSVIPFEPNSGDCGGCSRGGYPRRVRIHRFKPAHSRDRGPRFSGGKQLLPRRFCLSWSAIPVKIPSPRSGAEVRSYMDTLRRSLSMEEKPKQAPLIHLPLSGGEQPKLAKPAKVEVVESKPDPAG